MSDSTAVQVGHLSRRSAVRALKQPEVVIPSLVFPLFFLAVTAAGLAAAGDIPGFPDVSYLTFTLATTFVQAGLSGVVTAGAALTEDMQSGFLNRLSLTPIKSAAVVLGHLAGPAALGFVGGVVYLAVGLVAGADVEAGAFGAVLLVLISVFLGIAFGSIGVFVALRTGSGSAVQTVFPLLFVMFFLSSMLMPRDLMETEWFKQVATYNPISYLIEAPRSLLVDGWDAEALMLGGGIATAITVVSLAGAASQIGQRMVRT